MIGLIQNMDDLKMKLALPFFSPDTEGKERIKRFSFKLNERIFQRVNIPGNLETSDYRRAVAIANLLREGEILPLHIEIKNRTLTVTTKRIIDYYLNNKGNMFFMLATEDFDPRTPYEARHAEEFLTNIAEYARNLARIQPKEMYTSIAGKKRPCIGCSGRMEGKIDNFGRYPGRFWSHTIEYQSDSASLNALTNLITKPSYITACRNGTLVTDYDSGSDSEGEVVTEKKHL